MKIGIDFDNTIVSYDKLFYTAAVEKKLIPVEMLPIKSSIRNYLRSINKEDDWTELQGYVYGKKMPSAEIYPGVDLFFRKALQYGFELFIISHKTLYPFKGPKFNLHEAAKSWLLEQSFITNDISWNFELTLKEKLNKIKEVKCDFFIDDLPEVLLENDFPKEVNKILFDPGRLYEESSSFKKFSTWNDLTLFFNLI